MSMRILSVYYGNEIDDQTVKYEIIQSPKSLRKIASSAIHNDSGYEGLETSGWKSPMESMAWTHVSGLLHSTRRHWRHEDQDGGGGGGAPRSIECNPLCIHGPRRRVQSGGQDCGHPILLQ